MLVEFQQALVDLTSSPELVNEVRADPSLLAARYQLTDREAARLRAIAGHRGMAAACTLYRMNRVAPLAMNLRDTLRALGPALRDLVGAYWRDHPRGHAHFFIESARFAGWLRARIDAGGAPSSALPSLEREAAAIEASLADSRADGY
ncbi:MAG TPA: hypothetical protein VHE35_36185 [Kofleriaceae bacterium]|nr:hypothetical protein [Kofleriaceae bacterium]